MKIKRLIENPLIPFCLTVIFAFLFFATLSRILSMPASASPATIITNDTEDAGDEIWISYMVAKGDTLNAIANDFLVLPSQVKEWNDLKGNALKSGQILIIKRVEWPSFTCRASWYGPGFHGKRMANGQIYDMNKILVAHRTLPLGLKLKITNLNNGKSIVAPILDRGPYTKKNGVYDRGIDLSFAAAKILGAVGPGIIPVKIEPLNL